MAVLLVATSLSTLSSASPRIQSTDLAALSGEWIFMEDLTEGRPLEQLNPPMGTKFVFRAENGAVVL
ncbi:MAG TPA: hypothetical protein VK171_08485, partial [Fimbriimonas sp.]|nr:hypothetical protein [Fimbriimonas sp.]